MIDRRYEIQIALLLCSIILWFWLETLILRHAIGVLCDEIEIHRGILASIRFSGPPGGGGERHPAPLRGGGGEGVSQTHRGDDNIVPWEPPQRPAAPRSDEVA